MSIKNITTNELRRMKGREGIIFPGCGGDLNDWLNGINATFNEEGLFLDGTKFTDCYVFKDDRVHCLLFPFDDSVKLDMGKLAKWRIAAHDRFYGTWLSDYVDSRLGGFVDEEEAASDSEERQKPDCPLIGADSNVFVQIGIAARTLRHNGLSGQASEMTTRAYASHSYDEALGIISEYVNPVSVDDFEAADEDEDEDMDEDELDEPVAFDDFS